MRYTDENNQPITRYEIFVDGEFEGFVNRPDSHLQLMKEYVEDRTIMEGHKVTMKPVKLNE